MYLFALAASVGSPVASKAYLCLIVGNQILLLDELGRVAKNNCSLSTLVHLFCKSRHIGRHGERWSDGHS